MVCAMADVMMKRILGMVVTAVEIWSIICFAFLIVNVWTPILKVPAKLILVLPDGLAMESVMIFATMKQMVSMEVTAAEMDLGMHFGSARYVNALNNCKLAYDPKHLLIK